MTKEERTAHITKNKKSRASSKRECEVQAATTEADNNTETDAGTASNPECNAGSQFGSNAYAKKRQRDS